MRFSQPQQLEYLMPVFWIGFNLAMFPGASLAKRYGALPVIADLIPALSFAPFVLWFAGAAVFVALARAAPRPAAR